MKVITERRRAVRLAWTLLAFGAALAGGCRRDPEVPTTPPPQPQESAAQENSTMTKTPADKTDLKKRLTPEQFHVTQEAGTELPFRNAYWNHHEAGIYVDIVTGEPLFSSTDKFDSGTGWPSFTRPIDDNRLVAHSDRTFGMERTEVRSADGGSHLGHVFDDGPGPGGKRFCINSASLRFVPAEQLEEQGYGKYLALFPQVTAKLAGRVKTGAPGEKTGVQPGLKKETATLAGGCFWGMEEILRKIPGVLETRVGYTGGSTKSPRYDDVKTGTTGHAESVEVVFDPSKLSYEELLGYFFRMHDPTTLNRQGNDLGTQYRSVIFYHSDEQKKAAERVKAKVEASGKWKRPVVTQIVPATEFTPAETFHQKYLEKNPGGYTCHYLRD